MKKFISFLFLAVPLIVAVTDIIYAARVHNAPVTRHVHADRDTSQQQQPQQGQGEKEIDNEFFSIVIPEGWRGKRTQIAGKNGANAVFNKGKNISVTITMLKNDAALEQSAEKTAENMRKRGMEVSAPVKSGDFYTIDFSKKGVKGKGWFGKNDGITAITIIIAPQFNEANDLLKAIKPVSGGLLPQMVE